MSGPKVVRIVTREEMISRSEALLAQMEAVVSHWEGQGARIGEVSDADREATRARANQIAALLKTDRFSDIQRQVPAEIAFLRKDLADREYRAIERAAEKKRYSRRTRDTAAMLLNAIRSSPLEAADDLIHGLEKIAKGEPVDNIESLLATSFSMISRATDLQVTTDEQMALARSLSEEASPTTLRDWLSTEGLAKSCNEREQRIDRYISELELLEGADVAAPFLTRLAAISAAPGQPQRNLMLDSIVLDLVETTRACQKRRSLLDEIREVCLSLAAMADKTASEMLGEAVSLQVSGDLGRLTDFLVRASSLVLQQEQQIAAVARRKAVLEGLSALGYEVREGMATAWAESGKMVIRKGSTPGYGVELSGRAETGRLQVRAVALGSDHDARRDRDIETLWCGEFKALQGHLTAQGGSLSIEQARGIGEVPLKVVQMSDDLRQEAIAKSSPEAR